MIRVLAADDELLARKRLERLLGAIPGVALLEVCTSGEAVLARLGGEDPPPDLLLLDINMPGLTGLDVSSMLPVETAVVFVTAHPEHALEAFGVGARDYLLKPVDAERLRRAIERIQSQLKPPESPPGRLAFSTPRGVRLVRPEVVSHAVFDGNTVVVHAEGKPLFVDGSLSDLERRLDPERFVRVHRRALVNLDCVTLLAPTDTGGFVAHMGSGERVQVSRQSARQLRRRLKL